MTEVVHVPPSVEVMVHAGVPRDAIDRPLGRLFVLLCQRYDLDPALRQLEVLQTSAGPQVYITADGYRHIALASGLLDGLEVDSSEGGNGWRAHVTVWRKGCAHPFTGRAGCGFVEGKDDPEAQAITRATRRALRNAFDPVRVEAQYADLLRDSEADEDAPVPQDRRLDRPGGAAAEPGPVDTPQAAPDVEAGGEPRSDVGAPPASEVVPDVEAPPADRLQLERQAAARIKYAQLGERSRQTFRRRHKIVEFDAPWPGAALHELLGPPTVEGAP